MCEGTRVQLHCHAVCSDTIPVCFDKTTLPLLMQVYWRVTEEKQRECKYKGKHAEVCVVSFKTELAYAYFSFYGKDNGLKED